MERSRPDSAAPHGGIDRRCHPTNAWHVLRRAGRTLRRHRAARTFLMTFSHTSAPSGHRGGSIRRGASPAVFIRWLWRKLRNNGRVRLGLKTPAALWLASGVARGAAVSGRLNRPRRPR